MANFLFHSKVWKDITERTERIRFLLIALLVFFLPFDLFYSSIILIGLMVTALLDLNKSKLKQIPRQAWLFQLIFFLGVLGYFYSLNKSMAGALLERQLTILLLPLILPLALKITQEKVEFLFGVLTLSCLVTLLYLFGHAIHTIYYDLQLPMLETLFSGAFFNHPFSRPVGIHAGYLSLYVAMSVFFLVKQYTRINTTTASRTLILFFILVLLMGLFFLASRNTIIATVLILIFVSPFYNSRNKLRYILVCLCFCVVGFLALTKIPYLRDRFSTELITEIKPVKNMEGSYWSAEPRYERWQGAFELIRQSPWLGYGTGDEIGMLKTEYMKRGLYISYIENFNAHNQYLSYFIKNGIIGLLLFLFALLYYLRLAFKSRNFLHVSFLFLILIGFYTENILDANKGIVFFALFNTLFGYAALAKKEEQSTPKQ